MERMTVLMIGSTGQGKSTLGNFLVNPDEKHIFADDDQTFRTARSNKPQTQNCLTASTTVSTQLFNGGKLSLDLKVIDTPGLNEGAEKDLHHMIDLVKHLQRMGEVRACVMVIKFNSKIDMQYKATVRYYSKLLPFMFERNVIIVMTDFATDQKSIRKRQRQHVDVEQQKNNTIREIVECGGLGYDPPVFAMDCLPDDDDERAVNLQVRTALLEYVHFLRPVKAKSLKVAKTDYVREEDKKKIQHLDGKVRGYNERLQAIEAKAKGALTKIEQLEKSVTGLQEKLKNLKAERDDKDSSEVVVANKWSVSKEWKVFEWLSAEIDLTSKWEVTGVKKWHNGYCKWVGFSRSGNRVTGRLEGNFMRGLYADVTLETEKRFKYGTEIVRLNQEIEDAEKQKDVLSGDLAKVQSDNEEFSEEMKSLRGYIAENRKIIDEITSSDPMTIEDALARLQILSSADK